MNRKRLATLAGLVGAVISAGCGPNTEMVLLQPGSEGPPRELNLASQWASFAVSETVDRMLLSCPLPGAGAGRKAFELYLRIPRENGTFTVGTEIADGEHLTGLFFQHFGRRAGCTRVIGGTVRISGAAPDGGQHRAGRLDLRCRDGTRITGRYRAERSAVALLHFEDEHAADVKHAVAAAAGDARCLADTRAPAGSAATPVR